jgi:putative transposase
MRRYNKPDDELVLAEIKEVLKARPSYGYKRVTAMINKNRCLRINKKRVYRVMDMNGLLLKKNKTTRNHRPTGKIITLHSDTRWCSDCFEVHCFNGEKVYVSFTLDCHDRECIGFIAQKRPLLAKDIQKLMISSVEARFNELKTSRQIQFLSDRGSIYRAKETTQLGRMLGLKSCFTSSYSPESNGMSEAFVGTIKRDYVYTSDCVDGKSVMKLIPDWIKDYNENAPHSGLKMMSPVEYRKSINPGV